MKKSMILTVLCILGLAVLLFFVLRSCQPHPHPNEPAPASFISYDGKIYQISSSAYKFQLEKEIGSDNNHLKCYKITDEDTAKTIAVEIKDSSLFTKYEFLLNESFFWNGKNYIIDYSSLLDGNDQTSTNCKMGKQLGKTNDMQIYESTGKNSGETLFVHPVKLLNSSYNNSFFLAAVQNSKAGSSQK